MLTMVSLRNRVTMIKLYSCLYESQNPRKEAITIFIKRLLCSRSIPCAAIVLILTVLPTTLEAISTFTLRVLIHKIKHGYGMTHTYP